MTDLSATAPDDDEDYYIPVEFVTITREIGTRRVTQISRGTTAWISQAQLNAADDENEPQ